DPADGGPQRQRSHVAHEDLGGVAVEPEEAQAGADQGAAEDGDLAHPGDIGDLQIAGDHLVAGDVGEDGVGGGGDHGGADRQTVQAVGQVDGVRSADEDDDDERDVDEPQVQHQPLDEGKSEGGIELVVGRQGEERHPQGGGGGHLEQELRPSREAEVAPVLDLEVIVGEADRPERHGDQDHDPDVRVVEGGPEQGRDGHREDDQHAAHGGSPGLHLVGLGADVADALAHRQAAQHADEPEPEEPGEEKRGDDRHGAAEGDVAEDVERRQAMAERVEEVIEHQAAPSSPRLANSAATAASSPTPREPLTSTRSPSRSAPAAHPAASAASPSQTASAPLSRAPAASSRASSPTPTTGENPISAARSPAWRWKRGPSGPSSRMSPSTAQRRAAGRRAAPSSARPRASGFELYESSMRVTPPRRRCTTPRIAAGRTY